MFTVLVPLSLMLRAIVPEVSIYVTETMFEKPLVFRRSKDVGATVGQG